MEISYKAIYSLKLIARVDKNICPATFYRNKAIFFCNRFQSSCTCSTYSNNSTTICSCVIYNISIFLINHIKFGMHFMVKNIIFLNWSKCTKTNMKCKFCYFHALIFKLLKKLWCKV